MAEEAEWAAYLYPGTDILVNKLGIQDDRFFEIERLVVARRAAELYRGAVDVDRTFDSDHLKDIHHHLTQDLYTWAGEYRTVTIAKKVNEDEPARWFLSPAHLDTWMDAVGAEIRDTTWAALDRNEFADAIADTHTYLNFGHLFRETNGRAHRIFLAHIAEQTPFALNFDLVDPEHWNAASRDSIRPGRGHHPDGPLLFEPGRRIFDQLVVDRASAEPVVLPPRSGARLLDRVKDFRAQHDQPEYSNWPPAPEPQSYRRGPTL